MASHQQLLYHIVFGTKERRLLLREDDFRDFPQYAGLRRPIGT